MDSLEHLMDLLGLILGSLHMLGSLDMTNNLHKVVHKKNVPDRLKLCGFGIETAIAVLDKSGGGYHFISSWAQAHGYYGLKE